MESWPLCLHAGRQTPLLVRFALIQISVLLCVLGHTLGSHQPTNISQRTFCSSDSHQESIRYLAPNSYHLLVIDDAPSCLDHCHPRLLVIRSLRIRASSVSSSATHPLSFPDLGISQALPSLHPLRISQLASPLNASPLLSFPFHALNLNNVSSLPSLQSSPSQAFQFLSHPHRTIIKPRNHRQSYAFSLLAITYISGICSCVLHQLFHNPPTFPSFLRTLLFWPVTSSIIHASSLRSLVNIDFRAVYCSLTPPSHSSLTQQTCAF